MRMLCRLFQQCQFARPIGEQGAQMMVASHASNHPCRCAAAIAWSRHLYAPLSTVVLTMARGIPIIQGLAT